MCVHIRICISKFFNWYQKSIYQGSFWFKKVRCLKDGWQFNIFRRHSELLEKLSLVSSCHTRPHEDSSIQNPGRLDTGLPVELWRCEGHVRVRGLYVMLWGAAGSSSGGVLWCGTTTRSVSSPWLLLYDSPGQDLKPWNSLLHAGAGCASERLTWCCTCDVRRTLTAERKF